MEKDRHELVIVQYAISNDVMLLDHIFDLLSIYFFAELLHSKEYIFSCNLTWRVCVELVKYGPEARVSKEALNVDRSSQELTVVDLLVIVVVNLIYHIADLRITYVQSLWEQDVMQLLCPNHSCSICVNSLKLSSKIFYLFLSRCLHKQIHCCFLESWNTFEAAKSTDDIVADLLFTTAMHRCSHLDAMAPFLEPGMTQRLLSTNSFLLIEDEQLSNQILTFIRDRLKLPVIEVVISLFDLSENLSSIIALERQISTHECV